MNDLMAIEKIAKRGRWRTESDAGAFFFTREKAKENIVIKVWSDDQTIFVDKQVVSRLELPIVQKPLFELQGEIAVVETPKTVQYKGATLAPSLDG